MGPLIWGQLGCLASIDSFLRAWLVYVLLLLARLFGGGCALLALLFVWRLRTFVVFLCTNAQLRSRHPKACPSTMPLYSGSATFSPFGTLRKLRKQTNRKTCKWGARGM